MRVLKVGVAFLVFGTVMDLAFHAVTEPEEAFDLSLPTLELADHFLIAVGVVLLILGGIAAAFRKD